MTTAMLARLVRVLAELYPDTGSTALFLSESGIDTARILLEQPPRNRWHFIVEEARKSKHVPQLLAVAKADYPAHESLLRLDAMIASVTAQPEYDLRRVVPPTPTGQEVDRIVGGRLTTAFADVCAVGNDDGYFCSGTLIRPHVVISAKHCAKLDNSRVYLGGHDVSVKNSGEIVPVIGRKLHPTADMMLLFLARPSAVKPRRIATTAEIDELIPLTGTLVGFGAIDFNGAVGYGVKRRVEVPITNLLCSGSDDQADFGCATGSEMIAGHRGLNRDSCKGDSGGPLFVQSHDGEYALLGVTSRGIQPGRTCGDGGIYVRADKFSDWIESEL